MKWLKHMADASDDEFMEELERVFGLEGYARWWKMLETIAKAMEKNVNDPSASHTLQKWCEYLKAKPKKLMAFLEHCAFIPGTFPEHSRNIPKIKLEHFGNVLKITCPNILKLRDNYTKDLQASGKSLASDPQAEQEAEANKDNIITTPLPHKEAVREKIEIPKHRLTTKQKELNNLDFDAAAAACCAIINKRLLPPSDAALLLGWLQHHNFETIIKPILIDKAQRFSDMNYGKRPASLSYFVPAIKEKTIGNMP